MPAEAKAAFDRVVGGIYEVAFGCNFAGKGETAGEQERAANEDSAVCLFHHVFPGNGHHALDNQARWDLESRETVQAANSVILTG